MGGGIEQIEREAEQERKDNARKKELADRARIAAQIAKNVPPEEIQAVKDALDKCRIVLEHVYGETHGAMKSRIFTVLDRTRTVMGEVWRIYPDDRPFGDYQ